MAFNNFQLLSFSKLFILNATGIIDLITVTGLVITDEEEIKHTAVF